jgi:hypothetical protein
LAIKFVKCRGWVASKRNGSDKIILQYRKVDEILRAFAPSEDAATMAASFKAMIDELCELQNDGITNMYTRLPAIRYLEKSSFIALFNTHCQESQITLIIAETFFMPHAPTNKNDTDFWMRKIFWPCS